MGFMFLLLFIVSSLLLVVGLINRKETVYIVLDDFDQVHLVTRSKMAACSAGRKVPDEMGRVEIHRL